MVKRAAKIMPPSLRHTTPMWLKTLNSSVHNLWTACLILIRVWLFFSIWLWWERLVIYWVGDNVGTLSEARVLTSGEGGDSAEGTIVYNPLLICQSTQARRIRSRGTVVKAPDPFLSFKQLHGPSPLETSVDWLQIKTNRKVILAILQGKKRKWSFIGQSAHHVNGNHCVFLVPFLVRSVGVVHQMNAVVSHQGLMRDLHVEVLGCSVGDTTERDRNVGRSALKGR